MSQTKPEVKQVPLKTTILGYYLCCVTLNAAGKDLGYPRQFKIINGQAGDVELWRELCEDELEDQAFLFTNPDDAAAEVKRLSELPKVVEVSEDYDSSQPVSPYNGATLRLCDQMLAVTAATEVDDVYVRFEIVPKVKIEPIAVALYAHQFRGCDLEGNVWPEEGA
jgi:hypothetical protein